MIALDFRGIVYDSLMPFEISFKLEIFIAEIALERSIVAVVFIAMHSRHMILENEFFGEAFSAQVALEFDFEMN